MVDEYSCPCLPTPLSFLWGNIFSLFIVCRGLLSISVTGCFVYPFQEVNGIFLFVFLAFQRLNLTWIKFEDLFHTA
jgi:hypothetical protein